MDDLSARLTRIVAATPWLMRILATVRDARMPDAYVAAGAVRDTVWDAVLGHSVEKRSSDVDVIYFDASSDEQAWRRILEGEMPEVHWEVTNQATVHHWQSKAVNRSFARRVEVRQSNVDGPL